MKVSVENIAKEGGVLRNDALPGLAVHGAMDYSNGFGFMVFGKSRIGDPRQMSGVYQRRVTGYNQYGRSPLRERRTYFVKMRSYAPTNPRTPTQQAHRQKFADAWVSWHNLTTSEKAVYNERATKEGRRGAFLYVSEYLKTH